MAPLQQSISFTHRAKMFYQIQSYLEEKGKTLYLYLLDCSVQCQTSEIMEFNSTSLRDDLPLSYLTVYSSTSTPGRLKPALVNRLPASRTYKNIHIWLSTMKVLISFTKTSEVPVPRETAEDLCLLHAPFVPLCKRFSALWNRDRLRVRRTLKRFGKQNISTYWRKR